MGLKKIKRIKHLITSAIVSIFFNYGVAQNVGINNTGALPNNSALLDIDAAPNNNMGLLIPRIPLTQTTSNAPIGGGIVTSLMVFNTATINDVTPGYYYWDGAKWVRLINTGNSSGTEWNLLGNAGTVDGINFLGTTDFVPLNFRINNQKAGRIDTNLTYFGYLAGNINTGQRNTAFGVKSQSNNTTGFENTSFGYRTLEANTIGRLNTAIGFEVLKSNTTGIRNTGMGRWTLRSNTSGNWNTAIGNAALRENTTGISNTALGEASLLENTTGSFNTALGQSALSRNTIHSRLVALGDSTLFWNGTGGALLTEAIANTAVGSKALFANTKGKNNTALGFEALMINTLGDNNVALGFHTLTANSTGFENVAIGDEALIANTSGFRNTAVGSSALFANTFGNSNTAVGDAAIVFTTTGIDNTAIGAGALFNNITGNGNTAVGRSAFQNGTAFSNSTAVGFVSVITASNQIRLGNNVVTSIGGQVGWTTLSDGRFKQNIKENVLGLDFILKLRPVSYNLNYDAYSNYVGLADSLRNKEEEKIRSKAIHTGFIAQEVEKAAKDLNFDFSGIDYPKNEKDYYGLRYAEFVVPLVKAVQELKKENDELRRMIIELQQK